MGIMIGKVHHVNKGQKQVKKVQGRAKAPDSETMEFVARCGYGSCAKGVLLTDGMEYIVGWLKIMTRVGSEIVWVENLVGFGSICKFRAGFKARQHRVHFCNLSATLNAHVNIIHNRWFLNSIYALFNLCNLCILGWQPAISRGAGSGAYKC